METTKTKGEAVALLAIVFLLGMVIGGVGSHLWGDRVWGSRQTSPPTRGQVLNSLTRELELTPDQQKQLAAIVDDTRAQWRTLYAPLDAQHEQIRQWSRDRIRAILTPEQKIKYDQFVQRLDEQRKKEESER